MTGLMNVYVGLAAVGFALVARLVTLLRKGTRGAALWKDVRDTLARAVLYANVLMMGLALSHWYPAALPLVHWLIGAIVVIEFTAGIGLSGIPSGWETLLPWQLPDQARAKQAPPKTIEPTAPQQPRPPTGPTGGAGA